MSVSIGASPGAYQPTDADLAAIAALPTTAYGRSLLELANAAALRTAGGLVIGTDVQAQDADLAAIAALTTTATGRALLEVANAAALRTAAGTVIGTDVSQPLKFPHTGTTDLECWYCAGQGNCVALSTVAYAAGTLWSIPFPIYGNQTIDKLAFNVTTLGVGNARIGLYASKSAANKYPGALLYDSGDIDISSTGVKTATPGAPIAVTPGLHHLVFEASVAVTVRALPVTGTFPYFGSPATLVTAVTMGLDLVRAYAALPDPLTSGAPEHSGSAISALFCHLSA